MKVTRGVLREMIEAEMLNERVGIGVDVRSNPSQIRRLSRDIANDNESRFSRFWRREFANIDQSDLDNETYGSELTTVINDAIAKGWLEQELLDNLSSGRTSSGLRASQDDEVTPAQVQEPEQESEDILQSDIDLLASILSGNEVLKQGSRGDKVYALQRAMLVRLRSHNMEEEASNLGEPDGSFGPKTKAAVEDLQEKYGVITDGVVGRQTWTAIKSDGSESGEVSSIRVSSSPGSGSSPNASANAADADDETEDATADGTEDGSATDEELAQEIDSEVTEEDIEFLNAGNEFESAELEEAADEDGVLFLVPATLATARVLSKGNRVAMAAYNMTIANKGSRSAARKAAAAASREIARGRSVSRALRLGQYTANMAQSGTLAETGKVSQFLNRGYQTGSRGSQAIAQINRGGSFIPNLTKTLRSYKTFNRAGRIFFVTIDAAGRVVGTATQLTKTAAAAAGRLAASGGRAVAAGANTLSRGATNGIARNMSKFGARVGAPAVAAGVTRVAGRGALMLVGAALAWPVTIAWLAADGLQWWGRRQLNNARQRNAVKAAASALKRTLIELDFITLGQGAVARTSITPMDLWQLEEALAGRGEIKTRSDVAAAWLSKTDLTTEFNPGDDDDWIDLDYLSELLKDKADELGLPTGPSVSARLSEAVLLEKWQKIIS